MGGGLPGFVLGRSRHFSERPCGLGVCIPEVRGVPFQGAIPRGQHNHTCIAVWMVGEGASVDVVQLGGVMPGTRPSI
jgi:hypothetical protein